VVEEPRDGEDYREGRAWVAGEKNVILVFRSEGLERGRIEMLGGFCKR
jgi:hypothetical protein